MFPAHLRNELVECLGKTFSPLTLQTFSTSIRTLIGTEFDSSTPVQTAFEDRVPAFVDYLIKKNTIHAFIKNYCENFQQHTFVQEFQSRVGELFDLTTPSCSRHRKSFNCPIIKTRLPFLDRESVADEFFGLVEEVGPTLVLLKGQPQSGLSYIGWYLSEISKKTAAFNFLDVDLREIHDEHSDVPVSASLIAGHIAGKIGISYSPGEFKLTPFLGNLNQLVSSKSHELWMIFIDQFEVPLTGDTKHLFRALAKLVAMENSNFFLVFSGYTEAANWEFEIRHAAAEVDIQDGSVTRENVDRFFESIFELLPNTKKVGMTKEQFVMYSRQEVITDSNLSTVNGSNVTVVGRKIGDWCKKNYQRQNHV